METVRENLAEAAKQSKETGGTCWYWWPSFMNKEMYIGVDNNEGVIHYFHEVRKDWIAELTASEMMRRMESVL